MLSILNFEKETLTIKIDHEIAQKAGVKLFLKREDLLHPQLSGNKWRETEV